MALEARTSGGLRHRRLGKRAAVAGLSAALLATTIGATGAVQAQDAAFDPMKYAGSTVRIALVDGERDEKCLQDREAEIEAATGIDIQLTTIALNPLYEALNQNLNAPESAFGIMHVLGFWVAGMSDPASSSA